MEKAVETITHYFSSHFSAILPQYAEWAVIYGWVGNLAVIVAVLTLLFIIFRREVGKEGVATVTYLFGIWALPYIIKEVLNMM